MLERLFLNNINDLFNEKKFDEIILKINTNNHFLQNYPDLYNIRAVSRILRLNIYKNILNTPLFDAKKFTRDFENKLLEVYIKSK